MLNVKCPKCGMQTVFAHKEDRTFQCKTGRVDVNHPPGTLFDITIPDYEWKECHSCGKQFHSSSSVAKMEFYRRKALNELQHGTTN
jgi:predicted nucleic-acid-binding Zn-ribbon protein